MCPCCIIAPPLSLGAESYSALAPAWTFGRLCRYLQIRDETARRPDRYLTFFNIIAQKNAQYLVKVFIVECVEYIYLACLDMPCVTSVLQGR